MTSNIIPYPPTGNDHRIILAGTDLIFESIDNIFVYPSLLDIDRLKKALSRTLSIWPILAGRVIVNDDQYRIEFSDQSIPFTYTENDQLECWPNLPVVIDDATICEPFIDVVQYKPVDEPLLRIKVTRLLRSNEYVFGTSFSHLVGDAASNIHFLNDLSRLYQDLEPLLPRPIFDRHLWTKEDADVSFLSNLKPYRNADKCEIIATNFARDQANSDQLNLSFSSIQLAKLHSLAGDKDEVTVHDALNAYMIVTMNNNSIQISNEYFQRAYILVNYRDLLHSIAPVGHVGNSFVIMLTSDFPNPFSLISIAKTIRQAINKCRHEDFLKKWIPTADLMMRQIIKDDKLNCVWDTNEVVINSNFKYDWSNQVDFGMTNQCRFHTITSLKSYFRIFRLNPVKDKESHWIKDQDGAEVSFRIEKGAMKNKFLETYRHDIKTNFINVE
ncbi:unnamed protein product [Rotaria sp. Silwood2]|nr:unnamed protein product [Rotaria sp. Silwood2]CAF2566427.1 unnamed protein product [Rotaria sp. Silwood2]CAF2916092.1 unnamed protein product [Rotaria sp. Silwood2]CAF3855806.1 unnamed protein product [Rotaria sp. Silwood2]CAF4054271.1 unnamed protein product [Rotaria sp. Silwood2]